MVTFRAEDELVAGLAERAREEQRSVSDLLRAIVRDKVVGAAEPTEMPVPIHTRAAFGDGEAFSILADLHYRRAVEGAEPAVIALARSADYARLAAISHNTRESWIAFIYVLEQQSLALRAAEMPQLADIAQAEAVAVAEQMGEQGDEEIGQLVVMAGESVSPTVLALARDRSAIGALERNHLHASFPGRGAPPLGGAKAAKLRNPLAGMPPPPTGFRLDAR